jgi:class 3 adenylate cyclase
VTTPGAKRKLTAILSADVKGYSRLMEDDEEATVATLTSHREVMTGVIEKHRGRVVDAPGDNLLAEFASVVDAMRGEVEIQEELKARNSELPDHRRMEFRIGINPGDVIEESGRIYGDGVNLAARVESLADPGGICVSETAYDHLKNKLSLGIEFLGEHEVKNISEPVPVYRLLTEPGAAPRKVKKKQAVQPGWKWAKVALASVLAIGAGGREDATGFTQIAPSWTFGSWCARPSSCVRRRSSISGSAARRRSQSCVAGAMQWPASA